MKRRGYLFFLLAALPACHALAGPAVAEGPLRVGVAEADITPPEGFLMAGYYHERRATGTRDPLKARALVFRGDGEQAALVVCDLTGIAADLTAEVRRRASARTGIPAAHIVVTATHSHTAPDYTRDLYDYLQAGAGKAAAGKEPYAARLVRGIVEAVVAAHARARPAAVEAGSARQETPVLSFNRRFVMKDGSVRTWMRLADPDVVRPAGPIDPEVGLLLVRPAAGGRPLGLLSNFALHLDTVGGTLWSADYPYPVEQALRKALGPDVVSVFGTGCCGDINHVDPGRKGRNTTDFIGRSLARTVEGALPHLRRVPRPTLRVRRATVPLPLREVTAEQVARARPLLLDARAGKKVDFFEQVAAYRAIVLDQLRHKRPHVRAADFINWGLSHSWAGVGDRLPVEVHVIALGEDVAIVCLPGEVFVDLGLAVKRASPFRTTLVVELANCVETMYVPTRAACAGGGYEVTNSAVAPGSGEMLVEAAVRLLRDVATEGARARRP
jgi:hypothetical protein